jgi:DNA-binding response OmpR family regulator
VIVVSISDDRELGFSLGAVDWLVKPANQGEPPSLILMDL